MFEFRGIGDVKQFNLCALRWQRRMEVSGRMVPKDAKRRLTNSQRNPNEKKRVKCDYMPLRGCKKGHTKDAVESSAIGTLKDTTAVDFLLPRGRTV